MADAQSQGFEVMSSVQDMLAAVQARGAHSAFMEELPEEQQRTYAEVSLMELSAYVCWRRAQASRINCGETPIEFEAAWDLLDCDDKAEWVPEDPRAVLASDDLWAPLLADGPPACGSTRQPSAEMPPLKHERPPAQAQVPTLKHERPPGAAGTGTVTDAGGTSTGACEPDADPPPVDAVVASLDAQSHAATTSAPKKTIEPPQSNEDGAQAKNGQRHSNSETENKRNCDSAAPPPSQDNVRKLRPSRGDRQEPNGLNTQTPLTRGRSSNARLAGSQASQREKDSGDSDTGGISARRSRREARSEAHIAAAAKPPVQERAIPSKLKLAPMNLCPEALDAVCCICSSGECMDDNDLGLCDRCDRAFHQRCHDPPVPYFGNTEDKWFCAECVAEIAKQRQLRLGVGEFVWATVPAHSPPWPARVLRIDFNSLEDGHPYWVQFFDTGPCQGNWVGEGNLVPWSESPSFASIRDARRKLAVRLAEAKGAEPISGPGPRAPIAPLPTSRAIPKKRASPPARRAISSGPRKRQRHASPDEEEQDYSSQMDEMRELIEAARERQRRLEREIDEAEAVASTASQA